MYTSSTIFAGMLARGSSNRRICHDDPVDNTSTGAGMVAREIINRSSRHGEPTDNERSGAGTPKTVYVGKNQYTISIVQLYEVSEIAWGKKAGFNLLTSLISSLSGGHNISDFITLVENEVTIDIYSALQDAETKRLD